MAGLHRLLCLSHLRFLPWMPWLHSLLRLACLACRACLVCLACLALPCLACRQFVKAHTYTGVGRFVSIWLHLDTFLSRSGSIHFRIRRYHPKADMSCLSCLAPSPACLPALPACRWEDQRPGRADVSVANKCRERLFSTANGNRIATQQNTVVVKVRCG